MASFHDDVYDNGLAELSDDGDELHLCSAEPTSYAEATSTYSLGSKSSPSVAAPADRGGGGRECVISAIDDGTVSSNGTVTHWALVDTVGSRLLATKAVSSSKAIVTGSPWTMEELAIGFTGAS